MAKQSNALKTGNAAARKPGRVDRFALTQAQADVAGQAGADFAESELHGMTALAPLAELLAPLSGQATLTAVEQWKHIRGAFVTGYADTMGCDSESAGRAWTRAVGRINADLKADGKPELAKPQTPKAKAEAARRAAAKPDAAEAPEVADEDLKPGQADDATAAVQMGLSRMEAHLIGLLRAGKFEMAAECVASMAAE